MTKDASASNAWSAVWRDARNHRSPNAGWPEAAMAGALGLSLAGPRVYGGVMVDDATMGDGRREANAQDIRAALTLYRRADAILIALVAALGARRHRATLSSRSRSMNVARCLASRSSVLSTSSS